MTPVLRTASAGEVQAMLDWAAAEGWNPGLEDAGAFQAADPGGFFVAEQAGQMVAAISVVNHCDRMAFLGLYICRPDRRGQGIGRALLAKVKETEPRLALWTFQANTGAIAFYSREGFAETGRTDGAGNEERLPDVRMIWRRPA